MRGPSAADAAPRLPGGGSVWPSRALGGAWRGGVWVASVFNL